MTEKYSYSDVIIDPADSRIEIGKEYWFADYPFNVLLFANRDDGACRGILSGTNRGDITPFFIRGKHYACLIRKKEPRKRYEPFDLTKEEDRARLRGVWVRIKDCPNFEYQIVSMNTENVFFGNKVAVSMHALLLSYEFADGTPCGKLRKEEA